MGQLITTIADRHGKKLDVVAAEAGISYPTLSRICSGAIASPRLATVVALADALGTTPDRLIVRPRRRTG